MSRYYGYRRRRSWYSSTSSKKDVLRYQFGEIVHDIEQTFLNLPTYALNALFIDYGRKYGNNAETYARNTYSNWKSRATQLSGQTAERLIELLPHHLTAQERFNLVKKLRNKYIKKSSEHVSVPPDNWKQPVHEAIIRVIQNSREFKLPDHLYHKATWLANGDVAAAQQLLNAAEEDEARLRAVYLDAEFKRISLFVSHIADTESVSHNISIPQGDIYVTISLPKKSFWDKTFKTSGGRKMSNDNDIIKRESLENSLVRPNSNSSLLNLAHDNLSTEEQIALRKKVLDEKLALDVSQHKADQRFYDSTRDMANTVRAVNSLEQSSKSDYEVRSTFKTASGQTDITVKKNNNTVIIVIAIVVGVIIFMMVQ